MDVFYLLWILFIHFKANRIEFQVVHKEFDYLSTIVHKKSEPELNPDPLLPIVS
ncbi:hypothetical protein JMA_09470 [Jeotgalibacillus malaysiensis]|uniref:Uncharacterized protein n=1 Tax=Jeotgalibacillus malaysiensis TaxID=1508404 RepID=A0A0B5AQA3_9BACL|nr:hypothetical protein JMA_09470 [Jeotgalibacillus malaysiensis]